MHRLSDVRGGVVDHDRAGWVRRRDAEPLVGEELVDLANNDIIPQPQVDKPWPGNFDLGTEVVELDFLGNSSGEFLRIQAMPLGE